MHEGARGTYNIESEIQRNNEEQTRGLSVDFLFQNSPTRWLLDYLEMRSPQRALGLETEDLSVHLESPLDCQEIQPVHPKWNQPWDFFGRNDAKAETPVLWPPHAKS